MLAEIKANQAKADANQAKMEALTGSMQAELKRAIEEKMKDAMKSKRSELDETIRQRIEIPMTNTSRETHNFQTELTERIEKTQVELQAVELSLDPQAKKLQENLEVISTDLTMADIEVKTSREEALEQQRVIKEKTEANMRKFQAQLEEVRTTAQRRSTPAVGASTVQPLTFNGNSTWSVFRRQFEIVAEHNHWSDRDKSTYLITALKGRAADVLYSILTSTTYEETLQALEDHFGDQHFSAAYRCQLTTRTQKTGESLQDFATAIEQLAHRAYPTLPEDHIRSEAGRAFACGVKDPDINIELLLGGEKTVNEALRQALELQAVLVAARPHQNNTNTYRGNGSPPTRRKDAQQSGCWSCGEEGHFERNCPYGRKAENNQRQNREVGPPKDKREWRGIVWRGIY
jgi:hypothetical protein